MPVAPPAPQAPPRTEPLEEQRTGPVPRLLRRHPAVVDWIVALWYGLPAAATIAWATPSYGPSSRVLAAGLALVAVLALLQRRREPVVALAVIAAALVTSQATLGDTTGLEIAAVLTLYAVAAYRLSPTA